MSKSETDYHPCCSTVHGLAISHCAFFLTFQSISIAVAVSQRISLGCSETDRMSLYKIGATETRNLSLERIRLSNKLL